MNRKQRRRQERSQGRAAMAPDRVADDEAAIENAVQAAMQSGDWSAAIGFCERLLDLRPSDAGLWNNLGILFGLADKPPSALDAFRRAVELNPSMAMAHVNLGMALMAAGRLPEAEKSCRRAAELEPGSAAIWDGLGAVILARKRADEAVGMFRRALELAPGDFGVESNLCTALVEAEAFEDADALCQSWVAKEPANGERLIRLATVRKGLGRFDDAAGLLRDAIANDPKSVEAYYQLGELGPGMLNDDDLAAMEGLLAADPPDDGGRILLGFALANALDRKGETERAFAHLEDANVRQYALTPYAPDNDDAWLERVTEHFGARALDAIRTDGAPVSPTPIFILGMPRSGSTLLEQILASHSLVAEGGELSLFAHLMQEQGLFFPGKERDAPVLPEKAEMETLGRLYGEIAGRRAKGAPYITDKTPNNFQFIGLISAAVPGAVFVHSARDPVDTCLSCYLRWFKKGQHFSYDLGRLGRYFTYYHRMMAHWRSVLPGRVLDVVYEDVVDDQEGQTRRLLEHCGLPWEDACLQFHKTRRTVRTASASQVRRPLYRDSVRRWTRYRDHLGPLLEALGSLAENGAAAPAASGEAGE